MRASDVEHLDDLDADLRLPHEPHLFTPGGSSQAGAGSTVSVVNVGTTGGDHGAPPVAAKVDAGGEPVAFFRSRAAASARFVWRCSVCV